MLNLANRTHPEKGEAANTLTIETNHGLKDFEIKILTSGLLKTTLPCCSVVVDGVGYLQYDTAGHVSLSEYPFEHLDQILSLLYSIVIMSEGAADYLLLPEWLILDTGCVFVGHKTGAPRLIYAADLEMRQSFNKSFTELANQLKSLRHVIGLNEALDRISERVCRENPDLHVLALIIDSVRSEWNIIYPR